MKVEFVTITPAIAEKMLAQSTNKNRPLNELACKRFARDMSDGKWKMNGESIVVDDNGNVVDGQHRLKAVIVSQTKQVFAIVRGVSPNVFDTIDSGKARSKGDILAIAGYRNYVLLAATLVGIEGYKRDNYPKESGRPRMHPEDRLARRVDILDLAKKYPEAAISASWIKPRAKHNPLLRPPSFAATIHYILGEIDKEKRDNFFDTIYQRSYSINRGDPIRRLARYYDDISESAKMRVDARLRVERWETAFRNYCKTNASDRKQAITKPQSSDSVRWTLAR